MSCQLLVTTQCERAMNSLIAVSSYENSTHTKTQHHGTLARNMCVNCWRVCVCVRKKFHFISRENGNMIRILHNVWNYSHFFDFFCRFGYAIAIITTANRNSLQASCSQWMLIAHYRLLPRSKYYSLFLHASISSGYYVYFFFALSIAFLCYSRQIWVSAQIFFRHTYVENVCVCANVLCYLQCGAPPNRRSYSLVQNVQSTFIMNHFVCWNISFAFL